MYQDKGSLSKGKFRDNVIVYQRLSKPPINPLTQLSKIKLKYIKKINVLILSYISTQH